MLDDELRREILESQKAQESLAKWKVAMIAGLGAAGLGAASIGTAMPAAGKTFLLGLWCLIPFVCVYTDTVCYHVGIRILTIARYFRLRQDDENYKNLLFDLDPAQFAATRLFDHYEWHSLRNRMQFRWEPIANISVSILLSISVAFLGQYMNNRWGAAQVVGDEANVGVFLTISGALGLVGSWCTRAFHERRAAKLDDPTFKPEEKSGHYAEIPRNKVMPSDATLLDLQATMREIRLQLGDLTRTIEDMRRTNGSGRAPLQETKGTNVVSGADLTVPVAQEMLKTATADHEVMNLLPAQDILPIEEQRAPVESSHDKETPPKVSS